MKRGTKEFYEVKSEFEKGVKAGLFGYLPRRDLTEDDSMPFIFYQNAEVNIAFRAFAAGYAVAKCEYQQ